MACLDLQGKAAQVPVYELLGGKVTDTIPVSGLPVLLARQQGRIGEVSTRQTTSSASRDALSTTYGF